VARSPCPGGAQPGAPCFSLPRIQRGHEARAGTDEGPGSPRAALEPGDQFVDALVVGVRRLDRIHLADVRSPQTADDVDRCGLVDGPDDTADEDSIGETAPVERSQGGRDGLRTFVATTPSSPAFDGSLAG
jgi:hypothetical protein